MNDLRPALQEHSAGGQRWFVAPQWRDVLLDESGLRLAEWLNLGLAHVIKHGPHRTVYRVQLPQLDFYLKHYRLADGRAWLRQLVRPSKARREFSRALAVAECAVPTITPLALGENASSAGPGESFLLTHSLEDVEPLNVFLESTLPGLPAGTQARVRQALARVLGQLVARLHDAGIRHDDLHAANLLLQLKASDPHLYLIDLHDVELGPPLAWAQSRDNLVILNRWFVLRASRADRLRFWRAYRAARSGLPLSPDRHGALPRDLERRTWLSNLAFWERRDHRCLKENRYYQRLAAPGVWGYAVQELSAEALAPLLADPDGPFAAATTPLLAPQNAATPRVAVILKDSPSSTVVALDMYVDGNRYPVIYKRFKATSWGDGPANLVRHSAALRSWVLGQGLRERCLPTARPLAVFHRRRAGLDWEGYLLTERVPDAEELHEYLARLGSLPPEECRRVLRRQIDQLARLVRGLHERRLSHRDLKAANILVSGEALVLVDLVGLRVCRWLSQRRRVQNLARLHASFWDNPLLTRTDKLRFLRVYQQWGLFGNFAWKIWWRDIAAATQAKIARNQRHGRKLA